MIIRYAVRAVVGIGGLLLSQGLAWRARAQNPPAQGAAAQGAVVSGVVVDSAGNPLHAVVSVVGESLRVVTDSAGRFRLASVPLGLQVVAFRALGYQPRIWALALDPGQGTTGRIVLHELPFGLPEITVIGRQDVPSRLAGFYQRRRTGLGKYIDREAIARRLTNSIADLLQGIAGVRVGRMPGDPFGIYVAFARCGDLLSHAPPTPAPPMCVGKLKDCPHGNPTGPTPGAGPARSPVGVYVDGFRALGDPGEILGMINPADVEAIEVYRGPSELPAEFMSDDCAAIVIWTRY
jgi:hypothetical protein